MFDSFYSADGEEYQTKAFDRTLAEWNIGDKVPAVNITCQVEVWSRDWNEFALLENGVLVAVPVPRDVSLPFFDYQGYLYPAELGGK